MEKKQKKLLFYKLTTGMYHLSVCWEGRKKNCTKHVLFPLEHKIYTCTQIPQCEMIHIETIQMSLSMNTFERKKGNKMLEVRRG